MNHRRERHRIVRRRVRVVQTRTNRRVMRRRDLMSKPWIWAVVTGMCCTLVLASTAGADGAQVIKVPFRVSAQAQADIAACVAERVTFTDGEFNIVIQLPP